MLQVLRNRSHVPTGLDADSADSGLGPGGLRRHDWGDSHRPGEQILQQAQSNMRHCTQIRRVSERETTSVDVCEQFLYPQPPEHIAVALRKST